MSLRFKFRDGGTTTVRHYLHTGPEQDSIKYVLAGEGYALMRFAPQARILRNELNVLHQSLYTQIRACGADVQSCHQPFPVGYILRKLSKTHEGCEHMKMLFYEPDSRSEQPPQTDQSTDQQTDQLTDQLTDLSVDQSIDQPSEQPTDQSASSRSTFHSWLACLDRGRLFYSVLFKFILTYKNSF